MQIHVNTHVLSCDGEKAKNNHKIAELITSGVLNKQT